MANFNFNKVILGGRLTSDPELKTTQAGVSVVSFRIAVGRRYNNETDFFSVTAWRQTAEFISKYFRKGSCICVVGSLQTRSWDDNEGKKRTVTEIQADEAFFVDSKDESVSASYHAEPRASQTPASSAPAPSPNYEPLGDDEEMPF